MLLGLFVPTPTLFTKTSYHLQSVCVPRPKPASLSLSILPSETCSLALIDAQNDTQNHSKPSTVASSYTFTEKFCNLSKYGNPKFWVPEEGETFFSHLMGCFFYLKVLFLGIWTVLFGV